MAIRNLKSKKAQEPTAGGTIVGLIIILALLVIILIFIFNIGGLRDRLFGVFTTSNLDDVRSQCKLACDLDRIETDYVQAQRDVIFLDKVKFKASCSELESAMCLTKNGLRLTDRQTESVCEDKTKALGVWEERSWTTESSGEGSAGCYNLGTFLSTVAQADCKSVCKIGEKEELNLKTKTACEAKQAGYWEEAVILEPCMLAS